MHSTRSTALAALASLTIGLLAYSGLHPYDLATWALEVFPVVIALIVLTASYRRYPLSTLLYLCIFVHAVVLITGGAYSYARVPLGFEIAELLHLERNPYDRIGHFFQGFVPALVAREILIRGAYVHGRRMLSFLVVCVVLAISASYEIFEWWTAVILGQGAEEFLGTQGDQWDTQSDMLAALIGAVCALLFFARLHDRQIAAILPSLKRRPGADSGHLPT
jgi:putative membrane protein